MDVRGLEIDLSRRTVQVRLADARGERAIPIDGEAAEKVIAAAGPLMKAGAAGRVAIDLGTGAGEARRAAARAASEAVRTAVPDPEGLQPSEAGFWGELYRRGGDGWELGRAAPPLARWFAEHSPAGRRAVVVGCGRGHEARMLSRAGAEVTGVDFSEAAIEAARALTAGEPRPVTWRVRDLFALPEDAERYDLVVEHTCFCALDPARRPAYVSAMAEILVEGGELVGLFWNHGRTGGPPWGITPAELEALFQPRFTLAHLELAPDSVATRAGQEWIARFRKR